MRVGTDVRLLHDVFSLRVVSQNRHRNPVQTLIVPAHKDLVERSLAAENPLYDLFILDVRPSRDIKAASPRAALLLRISATTTVYLRPIYNGAP